MFLNSPQVKGTTYFEIQTTLNKQCLFKHRDMITKLHEDRLVHTQKRRRRKLSLSLSLDMNGPLHFVFNLNYKTV